MAGESRIRQVYEFRNINGITSNPSASEDNKFLRYKHDGTVFEYVLVGDGGVSDINEPFWESYIENLFDLKSATINTYLASVERVVNTDTARFTLNTGIEYDLLLGALAWENSVEATLDLPGDTKVLFDDGGINVIGGEAEFTYNKTSNKLQFIDTKLVFKTGVETYQEGFAYLGDYSFSIANGSTSSTDGGSFNISAGYRAGNVLAAGSSRNTILGANAGEVGSTLSGSVFLGAYAGRYETASNKFFLDNQDHTDITTARSDSFLYADLDTERRLYVRDRLSVEKEGKFGDSGILAGAGETGMLQFVSTGVGTGKYQYYSDGIWNDFANGTDTYLDTVSYSSGVLTFTLLGGTIADTVDISGVNTTTFATSPSSPATGQVTSDYGYLQISNSSFGDNEGFTYKTDLRWTNSPDELNVPGVCASTKVRLSSTSQDSSTEGTVIWNGSHFFGKVGASWVQMDNEVTTGQANELRFDGSVATHGDMTLTKDGLYLPIKGLKPTSGETRLSITDNPTDKDLDVDLTLTPTLSQIGVTATPTTSGGPAYTIKSITTPDSTTPTWNNRPIICIDGSVQITTTVDDEIILSAPAGAGNPNTYTWQTPLVSGSSATLVDSVNSNLTDFFVKELKAVANTHINIADDGSGELINFSVDDINFTFLSSLLGSKDIMPTSNGFTLEYKGIAVDTTTGLSSASSTTEDIIIEQTIPIPYFAETVSGTLDSSNTGSDSSTIIYNFTFDADVRDANYTGASTKFFELNIGDGLDYDDSTNTISANVSGTLGDGGGSADRSLTSIPTAHTGTNYVYNLTVSDQLGADPTVYPITVPKYILPNADYSPGDPGGVFVNKSQYVWDLATTQQLTVDNLTGELSISPMLVAYDQQNALLNEDIVSIEDLGATPPVPSAATIISRRDQARANIGAAYVEGNSAIDFNADNLTVTSKVEALSTTDTHELGHINIKGAKVSSNGELTLGANEQAVDGDEARIVQTTTTTKVYIDSTTGVLEVYATDGGGNTKLMVLDQNGDLYIKGKIYSGSFQESYDTDNLPTVGITPAP